MASVFDENADSTFCANLKVAIAKEGIPSPSRTKEHADFQNNKEALVKILSHCETKEMSKTVIHFLVQQSFWEIINRQNIKGLPQNTYGFFSRHYSKKWFILTFFSHLLNFFREDFYDIVQQRSLKHQQLVQDYFHTMFRFPEDMFDFFFIFFTFCLLLSNSSTSFLNQSDQVDMNFFDKICFGTTNSSVL